MAKHPYLKMKNGEPVFVLPAGDKDAIIAVSAYAGNIDTLAAGDSNYHEAAQLAKEAVIEMANWQTENADLVYPGYKEVNERGSSSKKDTA